MPGEKFSVGDLLARMHKDYGTSIASFGPSLLFHDRIPTGLFPFDLATGGGFPRGRASVIYGPESANKTNMALRAIANHQQIWPEQVCAFFDIENSLDPNWAGALGVDVSRLLVVKPDYGEQAVDLLVDMLHAEDIGLVVLDSLAAMLSTVELESSAERANVGGSTILIGKMVRKVTHAFNQADKEGRRPSLIYINQIRSKIGVMFGDPETVPGGNAPKFQSLLTVRLWGKSITDPKVSQVLPVLKEVSFIVRKWKVPIVAASGKFEMVTYPHDGLVPGETTDWNLISQYLKGFGQLAQKAKGKGWVMLGEEYPTQQACKERIYQDRNFGLKVRRGIIQRIMDEGTHALLQSEV